MPRPLHAGDVLRIEPLSRDSWHLVVKLRKLLGVWANGNCEVKMGLHWLCSAARLFGGWANCFCGVRVGGRRSG